MIKIEYKLQELKRFEKLDDDVSVFLTSIAKRIESGEDLKVIVKVTQKSSSIIIYEYDKSFHRYIPIKEIQCKEI